jgi:hypothetical protein
VVRDTSNPVGSLKQEYFESYDQGQEKVYGSGAAGVVRAQKLNNLKEQARGDIQEAVFSKDEIQDMPMELLTQNTRIEPAGVELHVCPKLQV